MVGPARARPATRRHRIGGSRPAHGGNVEESPAVGNTEGARGIRALRPPGGRGEVRVGGYLFRPRITSEEAPKEPATSRVSSLGLPEK